MKSNTDIGKTVIYNYGSIKEKGTIIGESKDKLYWLVNPFDPRVTNYKWAKDICLIVN